MRSSKSKEQNALYQREYRARMAERGAKQITGFVPEQMAPSMRNFMAWLLLSELDRLDDVQVRDRKGKFIRVVL